MRKPLSLTIIVPTWNAETTITLTLDSLKKQRYPIKEIIIIDNHSDDNSVGIIQNYIKKNKKMPIRIITQPKNMGLGVSYNLGLKLSKSDDTVIMHSDVSLPTERELERLIEPFIKDPSIVGTYSWTVQPENLWKKFPFWEKCLFAREVERITPNMSGLFDCVKTEIARKIGGYNVKDFGDVGGEDADFYLRLIKEGKAIPTKAKVIHVHYLKDDYSFSNWMLAKKKHAAVYGRVLRVHGLDLGINGVLVMSFRPILALTTFIPMVNIVTLMILIFLAFYQTKKMFLTKSTLYDLRVFLLPFINTFFIYYQAYWTLRTFAYRETKLFIN